MRKRRAQGGIIPNTGGPRDDLGAMRLVSRGCVVVPDSVLAKWGRETLEKLNGGNSDVYSASEMLAAQDDDG